MDLIDIFRAFHPNAEEYTFFSSADGTLSRIDHILGHKSNLSKFKKIEIISSIFSDHNVMRLDVNYKGKTVRNTNTRRLNNMFVNIYAPNIGGPQYIRQTLTDMKGEIDSNTILVGDFNTPLSAMDRSSKQKINKETHVLNDTLDEMDLIDIFMTFHPNAEEYTFFSSAHGTFSRIQHILGHKSNLSKFKKIEIISSISDHSTRRLGIN